MLLYSIRRVLSSVLVLIASSMLVFGLAAASADPLAPFRTKQPLPPPEFFKQKAHDFGLDQPVPVRYWHWLTGLLRGNFGNDIDGNPVRHDLLQRLGVTSRMIVAAMILAVFLAIIVGVITAVRAHRFSDYVFTTISYMLIALPAFWIAALLKEYVAIRSSRRVRRSVRTAPNPRSSGIVSATSSCRRSRWQR
jgi:peptide/nickel transport system permease protein